jgi:hypothetical protein
LGTSGSQNSGSKKGGSGALSALIEPPPSKKGGGRALSALIDPPPFGTATLRCNPDGSLLFHINAQGLDASCNSCKVSIYDGTSCDTVGTEYFDEEQEVVENTYSTYGGGLSKSAFSFSNGYTCDENEGRVVVMYDSSSEIIGCGVLGETTNVLEAQLGLYPEYKGDLEPEGKVKVAFNGDDTFEFSFDLEGLGADVAYGGVHIHAGKSCDSPDLVLGHYWNAEVVRDLWTAEGGSIYSTDKKGRAKGSFNLYNGFGIEDNYHHAVVVHAKDGTRAACGVLYYEDKNVAL